MQGRSLELDFTEEHIKELIIKHRGRISWMADEMGVARNCLYDYIDIHDLHGLMKKARFYRKEERNDTAEKVLEALIDLVETDPSLAFKSATYILEAHGKDRGYGKASNELPTELADKQLDDVKAQAKDYYETKSKTT